MTDPGRHDAVHTHTGRGLPPGDDSPAADVASGIGLRDRKKRQTRQAIYDAAMALFLAKGYTATTIREIAAAAGVATRTFFAYFETKEALLFEHYEPAFASLPVRLSGRPDDQSALQALRAWLIEDILDAPPIDPRLDAFAFALADEVPAVAMRLNRISDRIETHLARGLAQDLNSPPGDPTPHIAAAATVAALYKSSIFEDGAATAREETLANLDRALFLIEHGIAGIAGVAGRP
ncbi:MAG: TetR/AcrR family transcriptional regulator [Chloroflexia bacterium]|nr:TetR/AcrR family transcriptional regulator [Chloroflexia bacterium]